MSYRISSVFLNSVLTGYSRRFGSSDSLLRSVGLDPAILTSSPRSISAAQFFNLVDRISLALGDEFLGFTSEPCRPGTFGMMCRSIIHSPTLFQALNRSCRFYNICNGSIFFSLKHRGGEIEFKLLANPSLLRGTEPFIYESIFAIWHRLSCWLVGRPVALSEIRLPFAQPSYFKNYFDIFNCPILFEDEGATMVIRGSEGPLNVVRTESDLKQLLTHEPFAQLFDEIESLGLYSEVRTILESLSEVEQTMEIVAKILHLSPQTLHRRLKSEGIRFMDIKDHLRRDRAISFLLKKQHSIDQIAQSIGFSEPSTFHRAFKKWTGMTPGEYRRSIH